MKSYILKKQNHCNLNLCAQITVYETTIKYATEKIQSLLKSHIFRMKMLSWHNFSKMVI